MMSKKKSREGKEGEKDKKMKPCPSYRRGVNRSYQIDR